MSLIREKEIEIKIKAEISYYTFNIGSLRTITSEKIIFTVAKGYKSNANFGDPDILEELQIKASYDLLDKIKNGFASCKTNKIIMPHNIIGLEVFNCQVRYI